MSGKSAALGSGEGGSLGKERSLAADVPQVKGECLENWPTLAVCLCVEVGGVDIGEVSTGIGASQADPKSWLCRLPVCDSGQISNLPEPHFLI